MRIAIVTGRDSHKLNEIDGGSLFANAFARALSAEEHAVTCIIPSPAKGGSKTVPEQDRAPAICDSAGIQTRFVTVSHPPLPSNYFDARHTFAAAEAAALSNKLFRTFDLICVLHLSHAFNLLRRPGYPVSQTVLFPMMLGSFYKKWYTDVSETYIAAEQVVLRAAAHICTPSRSEYRSLQEDYAVPDSRIFEVPRGFNPEIFIAHLREDVPVNGPLHILSAGAVKPQKGQLLLIETARVLRDKGLYPVVHIAGSEQLPWNASYQTSYLSQVKEAVAAYRLEENIIFHGPLTPQNLHELMEYCHLAMYPSLGETFGKSVLESIVSGLPTIVCNDVPAFKEYFTNAQDILMSPRSAEALSESVAALLRDHSLYTRLSGEGIKKRNLFTWKNIVRLFLSKCRDRGIFEPVA